MTAYFGGRLAGADWSKMPDWPGFLDRMTKPRRAPTTAELIARFEAMAARGLARSVH